MNAFFVTPSFRTQLRLIGRDRQTFLQGMTTNDIVSLAPGHGCYTFFLNTAGQVLQDVRVVCLQDSLLLDLDTPHDQFRSGLATHALREHLEQYLIRERCKIEVVNDLSHIFLLGKDAPAVLESFGISGSAKWTEGDNATFSIEEGIPVVAAATVLVLGSAFDLYLPKEACETLVDHLTQTGALPMLQAELEGLRVAAGVPRFGVDFDQKTLAPETGQAHRAINYRKGCYIGQEIIARLDARGHTNRTFTGFLVDGDQLPESNVPVVVEEKNVGRVTSSAFLPGTTQAAALGYIRNEHAAPNTPVRIGLYAGRTANLPFVQG